MEDSFCTLAVYYEIKAKLGEGRFGVVYRARKRNTQDVYAVKQMKFTLDVTQREKFNRETALLKRTRGHVNIVSLIDIFNDWDTHLYIILEFCELGDLNRYVTTTNAPVNMKILFMHDMSNGLDFLHQNNIVHRDMKPANVLVTWSKNRLRPLCKVSDFGEAKMTDMTGSPASYLTSAHGTMAYIAPEVLKNHYTSSCDVFSLGVIFYALFSMYVDSAGMTGSLNPFVDGQCMHMVRFDKIQNAVERLQTFPTQLQNLTLEMLKTEYHRRVKCSTVTCTLCSYIIDPEGTGNTMSCILL